MSALGAISSYTGEGLESYDETSANHRSGPRRTVRTRSLHWTPWDGATLTMH